MPTAITLIAARPGPGEFDRASPSAEMTSCLCAHQKSTRANPP
jgi:hypothetical protein